MNSKEFDGLYTYDEDQYDEYYDSGDDLDTTSEYEEDGYDTFHDAPLLPVIKWKQLRIGDAILDVSNDGQVKIFGAEMVLGEALATQGVPLYGTPYRTYRVEVQRGDYRKYFVHDLVYTAFNGPPPPGYEVRHILEYTRRKHTIYSNRLGCLTIAPIEVSPLRLGSVHSI
jgi:hypothetical protein